MWHCWRPLRRLALAQMDRTRLTVRDEEMAEEFGRLMQSFGYALPRHADLTLFEQLMQEARAKGLNWVEGLAYVAHRRGRTGK